MTAAVVIACLAGLRVAGVIGPKPCGSCHDSAAFVAGTQASPHAKVECKRCHAPQSAIAAVVSSARQPLHSYVSTSRHVNRDAATVPNERCLACHQEVLEGSLVSGGIGIDHASCAAGSSCTDCHSTIAHGKGISWIRSYDMDTCLECHIANSSVACDLCHAGEGHTDRVKVAAFAVTHGATWERTHGMGDAATCAVCHSSADCAKCHGAGVPHEASFVNVHASLAVQRDARCDSCHAERFCIDCHGTQMPHSATFTSGHPAAAKKQRAMCDRCHAETDCATCHAKHVHPGGAISAKTGGRTL